jgi:hypothetical protein
MNLGHALLGSALLFVGSSEVVMAADAIVAAEPEPAEYIRVCDAYGTTYFYIPGTETCLHIGGYLRFEARYGRDQSGTSDWSLWQRAQVSFISKSETEWGTLTGWLTLRGEAESATDNIVFLDEGFIDLAGFRAGMQYSWWDDDPSGETDVVASNETKHNSIRYQYETDNFAAGISLDELDDEYETKPGEGPNDLGIAAQISGKAGSFSGYLLGGYDTDTQEFAVRGIGYADVGPGQLGVYGVYASGANYYYEDSEWTVGAQYVWKATDKWTFTPGVQYFHAIDLDADGDGFTGGDAWTGGITIDYQIAENFAAKLSTQYYDSDDDDDDQVEGFLRLQRNF